MGIDQNKNSSESRFDRLKKSVLQTDHPIFGKIKNQIPFFKKAKLKKKSKEFEKLKAWNERYHLKQKLVIFGISAFLSFFIFRDIADPLLDYKEGELAPRPLVSQSTFEFVDEETTVAKRQAAIDAILPIYDFDHNVFSEATKNLQSAFRVVRTNYPSLLRKKSADYKASIKDNDNKPEIFLEAQNVFSESLGIEISDDQFRSLVILRFSERVEKILLHLLSRINLDYIVSGKELLSDVKHGITIHHVNDPFAQNKESDSRNSGREEVFKNIAAIKDINKIKAEVEKSGKKFFIGSLSPHSKNILSLAKKLIIPNLTQNKQETERRKANVTEEIKPVMIKINKGELIIGFQDKVQKRHFTIMNYMEQIRSDESSFVRFLFTVVLLTVILYSLFSFSRGGIQSYVFSVKDILVFIILMAAQILMIRGLQFIAVEALIAKFPQIPIEYYYFIVPLAAGPAIMRMIAGKMPALIFSLLLAVVGGILLERNFFYACYILASSFTAASLATNIKTRGVIYKVGFLVGATNIVVIICIVASTKHAADLYLLRQDLSWIFWSGIISGLLCSMLVMTLAPVIEFFTGHTTDLRLLELANMNHPLLRDLMMKAPGTWQHSYLIGSLVEKAAENIGANPLLARVMAYYHDVGKMERPLYFIENQGGGYNRHDTLQPHMSAMIIREHVKKGQELGRKHKLPQPIIDGMSEHHGSSIISYFYNKARGAAEDPDSILESDYRYDGMKPQSKETALVMLGDVVEAATRSIADPTPLRLSNVVKNVLNKYFVEGQLSECDLTLRDLDLIAKSFLDILMGIYHARIEYGVGIAKDMSGGRKGVIHGSTDLKAAFKHKDKRGSQASEGSVTNIGTAIQKTSSRGSGTNKR